MKETLPGWLLSIFLPVIALVWALYYLNSRPLRRQEGARFLLDLIDSALEQGQAVEHHIISLARSRDMSIGVRFHLLAAYLEKGYALIPALEKVPELVPPQVLAMLKVGQSLGDFRRVMPACRLLLQDGTSQSRAIINYQVAFALVLNPLLLMAMSVVSSTVRPVLSYISQSLYNHHTGFTELLWRWFPALYAAQVALLAICFLCAIFLLGGTRFASWLEAGVLPLNELSDRLFLRIPWRRKRLQRDFSALLGLLLDAGLPEEKALAMAAAGTANRVFMRRAEQAAESLRMGAPFAEAVRMLDDTGEFGWRLNNGAHGVGKFFSALQGWCASLDARAFQLEQSATQVISTSLIAINAVTVILIAVSVYQFVFGLSVGDFAPGRLPHK